MRNFNGPKKRPGRESIDGIVPQQPRKLAAPTYYRGTRRLPSHAAAPQISRRRPHLQTDGTIEAPVAQAATPQLGNFAQAESADSFTRVARKQFDSPDKKGRLKKKREPGRVRSWWKRRSRKFKAGLITLVLLLGIGGFVGVRAYSFLHSVFAKTVGNAKSAALSDNVSPNDLSTEGDGRLNVLILGRGGDENEAPDLTDTMMIASIDLKNEQVSLLSIPRDTWANVDGSDMKINAAFETGKQAAQAKGENLEDSETAGIKLAISAVRNVAGVPIHRYVLVDYVAFRDVVNALGGIDINAPDAINDYFAHWFFPAGPQHLNGTQALEYARSRHGSPRGDFDRTEHQRELLVAMRTKAESTGFIANPIKVNSLANAVQKNIRTDLSVSEAETLYSKTKKMANSSIVSLDLAKPDGPLVQTGEIGNQSIVEPIAGLFNYTDIRSYARTNMIDPYLKQEAPTVAVYNASGTAGLGTQVGKILSGYGYKVLKVDTASSQQSSTSVIKQTSVKKPFTDRFLSVRFSTAIGKNLPSDVVPSADTATTTTTNANGTTSQSTPPKPDYVIILGTDFSIPDNDPTW
jgi:LCP family protein required for cell wall assembly